MFKEIDSNNTNKYTMFGKEENGGEQGRTAILSGSWYVSLRKFFYVFLNQQQQRKVELVYYATGPRKLAFLQTFKRCLWKQ